ncbi:hypothetical protein [Marinoscillum sp. MHG1-6]|uniref:hypothetical protein n=1 Tax=Marinoscillum sp. MHG1-6 TaxID=2959627 RepID=UPI002157CB32|nr:hypothetical protein [Marinoscillum sp. MHG1-6]
MKVSLVSGQGNLLDEMQSHEEKLLADTKQVNQFFRRFNGEETLNGDRLYEGDRDYHDHKLRRDYVSFLFDLQGSVGSDLRKEFVDEVTDRKSPKYLQFHQNTWFAEVQTEFLFNGRTRPVTLFMELQPQGQGYEWIISDVQFDPFTRLFDKDTTASKPFMHPMSHELDFMNLRKAFRPDVNPESFTKDGYTPDYVTLFLYELKSGRLQFETVRNVKFHFFDLEGWYFEVSKFNRPGKNSGWLISNLTRANLNQKELIKGYIYGR